MRRPLMNLGRRTVPALAALALLGACGDDDDASSSPPDTAAEAPAGDDDGGSDGASSATGGGSGTGFVQIGDERYELTIEGCVEMFGAMAGNGHATNDPDNVEVAFDLSPQDWQDRDPSEGWEMAGAITLSIEEPYHQWETGGALVELFDLPDGLKADDVDIVSHQIDERTSTATGTASFIDLGAVLAGGGTPVEGSFELSCPSG